MDSWIAGKSLNDNCRAALKHEVGSMKVHVVTAANAHLYSEVLDQFFRERHRIYVEEKGWREPSPDRLEKDQFDTECAVYLVGLEDDRVIAGSRLVPTSEPHLLSEVFPHLCSFKGVVSDPHVAEWTRGFIIPERRERGGILVKAQFCCAVMEYCLEEGITRVGGIQEMYWLPLWKRFGWKVIPIGEPAKIDGAMCVPAYFDVSEAALTGAQGRAQMAGSNLIHAAPHLPFLSLGNRGQAGVGEQSGWPVPTDGEPARTTIS